MLDIAWLVCAGLLTIGASCAEPANIAPDARMTSPLDRQILIDTTPRSRTVTLGETIEQRWILATDGEKLPDLDLIIIFSFPPELPVQAFRIETGGQPSDLTCIQMSSRQVLCLTNGVETTNYLTTTHVVGGDYGDTFYPNMLLSDTHGSFVGLSAMVQVDGDKWYFPSISAVENTVYEFDYPPATR